MRQPLLSIVIANYNYGRFLAEAIGSVVSQINDAGEGMVELIICDASSTDNSLEVIKKYEKYLAWWCSEKDRGQSHAFNKGFSHARGKFLTWLNADDVMLPNVIKKLKVVSEKYPSCEWFVGGRFLLTNDMKIVSMSRGRKFSSLRARRADISVWGPSSFFTKRILDAVGGVDERFYYTMDIYLWLNFYFKLKETYRPFIDYAWGFRIHDESKTNAHIIKGGEFQNAILSNEQTLSEMEIYKKEFPFRSTYGFWYCLISSKPLSLILSRFDTWRYKGSHYQTYFTPKGGLHEV